MTMPIELPYETCLELLSTCEVGRVAVCTGEGPRIVPVNFSVVETSVVFRTTPYSAVGMHSWNGRLAFEVDHVDAERREGWSVIALGRGNVVEDPAELRLIESTAGPTPWASGQRWLYVRLHWDELTGRRLGPSGSRVD